MPITSAESAESASLDEWVEIVQSVWGEQDKNRSLYDIWLHAFRHASNVGEQVRQNRPLHILEELTHFVLWLLTFAGRAHDRLGEPKPGERSPEESLFRVRYQYADLVWRKYPNRCPACFDQARADEIGPLACVCTLKSTRQIEDRNTLTDEEAKKAKALAIRAVAEQHKERKPSSLRAFQAMFKEIYGHNIEREPLPSIAFHLLEEVGEVADALIRIYSHHDCDLNAITRDLIDWRLTQLEDEIADITSWVFGLVVKLDQTYDDFREYLGKLYEGDEGAASALVRPFSLGRVLWTSYGSRDMRAVWCKHCRSTVCTCPITYLTDRASVVTVAKRVRDMKGA